MKILLGCGDEVREGWVHHDLWRHSPHVQVVHDLAERPWPWPNSSAEGMGRMFGRFYTERYWRVLTLVTDGVEIVVLMEKRG
jgi:hypothetical protein